MSETANKPIPKPADDPRRTFENAIARIQQRTERRLSQMPIFNRKRTPERTDPASEKQALTDAARALARLWKVSPALVRS
jgi:hypothetical protein